MAGFVVELLWQWWFGPQPSHSGDDVFSEVMSFGVAFFNCAAASGCGVSSSSWPGRAIGNLFWPVGRFTISVLGFFVFNVLMQGARLLQPFTVHSGGA